MSWSCSIVQLQAQICKFSKERAPQQVFFCEFFIVQPRMAASARPLVVQEPATEVFIPFLTKKFDHLETLLTIHRHKKYLSAGHCASLQCPVARLNAPKGPSNYVKCIMLQFQICYHSHLNASYKTKTNIDFRGRSLDQTPCKVLCQGLYFTPSVSCPKFLPKILAYFS